MGLSGKLKSKYYTIPIRNVMDVFELKNKSSGLCHIRVIVIEHDSNESFAQNAAPNYKHLDFECDRATAKEIKQTFLQVINFANSSDWKRYNLGLGGSKKVVSTKWSRRKQLQSST